MQKKPDFLKTNTVSKHDTILLTDLLSSANWMRTRISSGLKPFGLTFEQYSVMKIVQEKYPDGVRVKDISHKMLDPNSNTTRIIDRLIGKGLLLRQSSERDGRERAIFLTENGLDILQNIDAAWDEQTPFVVGLSDAETEQLSNLLLKLREADTEGRYKNN